MKYSQNNTLYLKSFILPLFIAIYLPLFHYGNNITILLIQSLFQILAVSLMLAVIIYTVFSWIHKQAIISANATSVLLVFVYTYGIFYDYLRKIDLFQVKHYTLLPFYILLAIYAAWFISKLSLPVSARVWNNMVIIMGILVLYNIARVVPVEIRRASLQANVVPPPYADTINMDQSALSSEYPDIYFIILDEFVGFEPMREYWKYEEIDEFYLYLKSKGFSIAEQSHSSSTVTLHQLSERLNYEEFPCCGAKYHEAYYQAISDNRVMRYLKARGYSTVVFDEAAWKFPAKTPVIADLTFRHDQSSSGTGQFWDEFSIMVANNTMARAFSNYYATEEVSNTQHRNFIYFTMDKIAQINEVPSPKFVYVHLMLPHPPFMFDENGNLVSEVHHTDWNYYFDQYKFSIKIASMMVDNILENADPNHLPVIVLQSDHGARNQETVQKTALENYPEEYKTHIMYTLYLPGYDSSELPQDIKPINTFPIVFNYLFDENIPLK